MSETIQQKEFKENKMGTMPVNRLLITMALPMMISMLVQALYNIVDSIFVAMICEDALTAVSMAFPMQNLMIGLGGGIGVGTNAILSKALGERDPKRASKYAMHGILIAGCGFLLFVILGLTITRWFFRIQGASEAITEYGTTYLSIVCIASLGLFSQMIFERLLQATGKTVLSMVTQMTGAIINIIFDPILIFGLLGFPKMGMAGAAVATVMGQLIAGCIGLVMNIKYNTELTFTLKGFEIRPKVILNILRIGVPSVLMVAIGSVMSFCVNKILIVFTSTAVAVFGCYFKIQSFAFMPVFGMNNGMIPIIAYNYGARRPDRMMKTLKLALIYAECIMLFALVMIQLFPEFFLGLFSASDAMYEIGIPAMRIISVCFIFAGFCVITSSYFQALGFSMYSMIISFTRQMIFLVPLAYIFSKSGNLNLVWFAWPIAELASVAICVIFNTRVQKKVIKPLYSEIQEQ